jgi:hypothetical protein
MEAFDYARLHVAGFYEEENLAQDRHAQFDDDGDGSAVGEASAGRGLEPGRRS